MSTSDGRPGAWPPADVERLRERYRVERDRRMQPESIRPPIEITGDLARYLDDPYTTPAERSPCRDDVLVAVVGGGFAGLILGARLRQAGIDDFRIIDKAGDFGGTWYWNRYPGAQCDTESYIYLPLLEDTGYIPNQKYAGGPEIFDHCRRIAQTFRLYENSCLSTEVTGLTWESATSRWLIETSRGDEIHARFVVLGTGVLHKPKLPSIRGVGTFEGHSFHTSRWDYAYTGGDSSGNLHNLTDKRVGVIGTGSTAVQVVPRVAQWAADLFIFQRTPASVDVRGNRPTDPDWAGSLQPGWQRERIQNFTTLMAEGTADVDLVMDAWTDIKRLVARWRERDPAMTLAEATELADFEKMNEIRNRVDQIVSDPVAADALKPWYRRYCKRPTFNDEYPPAFNRPNVHLVDASRGIDRIAPSGVVVDSRHYELDCLIFASGFELPMTSYTNRAGLDAVGIDEITLSTHWVNGMRSMFGVHIHGFPNLFHIGYSPQGVATATFTHLLNEIADHVVHLVRYALDRGIREIALTAEAEADWTQQCIALGTPLHTGEVDPTGRAFLSDCLPGFFSAAIPFAPPPTDEPGAAHSVATYGKGPMAFFRLLSDWRAAGDFAGLELRS